MAEFDADDRSGLDAETVELEGGIAWEAVR